MGIVDKLKQEFDLTVEWLAFEIHPETPPQGVPLSSLLPRADPEAMARRLNSMGAAFGITFRKIVTVSNSRLALEAGEFAKEQGRFDQFHHAVFESYFSQGKDIGDIDVLTQIAVSAGLDIRSFGNALRNGSYRRALEVVKENASRLGITAAPTFLLGDRDRIVGAQRIDVFRERLKAW